MVPIFADGSGARAGERRRLGTLVVRYRPDEALAARVPSLQPPSVDYRDFSFPLTIFLAAVGVRGRAHQRAQPPPRAPPGPRAVRTEGPRLPRRAAAAGPMPWWTSSAGRWPRSTSCPGGSRRWTRAGASGRRCWGPCRAPWKRGWWRPMRKGSPSPGTRPRCASWPPRRCRDEAEGSRPSFSEEAELREAVRRNPQLLLRDPASGAGGTQEMEVTRDDGSRMPAQVTRVPFEVRPKVMGTLLLVRDLATLRKVEGHLLEAGRYAVLGASGGGPGARDPQPAARHRSERGGGAGAHQQGPLLAPLPGDVRVLAHDPGGDAPPHRAAQQLPGPGAALVHAGAGGPARAVRARHPAARVHGTRGQGRAAAGRRRRAAGRSWGSATACSRPSSTWC